MLRVKYTNLDVLVAAVPTRGREILFIAISDIVVFSIYLYIFHYIYIYVYGRADGRTVSK